MGEEYDRTSLGKFQLQKSQWSKAHERSKVFRHGDRLRALCTSVVYKDMVPVTSCVYRLHTRSIQALDWLIELQS